MVLPWGEKTHAVTKRLPFFELSGNTYVVVVYASPPLNLRLSPGDRAKHERKMLSPVALVVALQAQNFRSCLCADEMDAPI